MNKKGFTLVELLAVIVILAVILTIAVPNMVKIINKSKEDTYNNQVTMIKNAADKYLLITENITWTTNTTTITVANLVSAGILDANPINPKTNKGMCGTITVTRTAEDGTYSFAYVDAECTP